MTAFKKILVPVDFSKHSERAVRIGAELARRDEGSLYIVHVYDPIVYPLQDSYVLLTWPRRTEPQTLRAGRSPRSHCEPIELAPLVRHAASQAWLAGRRWLGSCSV